MTASPLPSSDALRVLEGQLGRMHGEEPLA